MARCGRAKLGGRSVAVVVAWVLAAVVALPARATIKYGPMEISGSVDSQSLVRSSDITVYQFIQNRNTALLRFDYDWLQKGKLIDRIDVPWVKRSKVYLLYRGVYDSFWDIGPGGNQRGLTRYDDLVGGPISGNLIGETTTNCPVGGPNPCPVPGPYTRVSREGRDALKFENTLREAYIDFALADAPLSFRVGRQQVVWGESDLFRLMDIWNPLDLTWHLQQEDWDKIRVPLWLLKGIWDIGSFGPTSNTFVEMVYNPGDFQPGAKVEFLPAPWSVPVPNPVRAGQIQLPSPNQPILLSPVFDLNGTSFRQGDFDRNPADASEVGGRWHHVSDANLVLGGPVLGPLLTPIATWLFPGFADTAFYKATTLEGVEFTANYLYGRGRGIGAAAGAPFGLKIESITIPDNTLVPIPANVIRQNPADPNSPAATFSGRPVFVADVDAEFIHPYNHIFGMTGNWFEGNLTNTVFRLEMAYELDTPFQTVDLQDRVPVKNQSGEVQAGLFAPLGFTKRDVWSGMIGFDRPTWIKWLNARTTWFITGQFFWSYINGTHSDLRGGVLTAGEDPYFTPNIAALPANLRLNGIGRWDNGPYAGQTERTQYGGPGKPIYSGPGSDIADKVHQWELLATLAATSFYWGGTFVPFAAIAYDPVNRNFLSQLRFDYFLTNDFIIQPQAKFFSTLGLDHPASIEPWGVGGLNVRRDEVGVKVTYQF